MINQPNNQTIASGFSWLSDLPCHEVNQGLKVKVNANIRRILLSHHSFLVMHFR